MNEFPSMVEQLRAARPEWDTRVKPLLDQLCTTGEHALIHLVFHDETSEADVAHLYGITQAALSYRLYQAMEKLFNFTPVLKSSPNPV